MTKFPLCKKAGLTIESAPWHDWIIPAKEVEALLASAPVVKAVNQDANWFHQDAECIAKYQARVVLIEPIKQEPEEIKLLREIIDEQDNNTWTKGLYERTKAFLARRDKSCEHKNNDICEPHLAGARKCNDCGMVYNPNRTPRWQHE